MKLTEEESINQGVILKQIQQLLMQLHVEYLEEALIQMQEQTGWQMSAMVLDPNPHTAIERNELNSLKNTQLALYLQAAKNLNKIAEAELKLMQARNNSNRLEDFFR